MALLEQFMVKTYSGAAKASIELEAEKGKSLLVKEIGLRSYGVEFGEMLIDRLSVGFMSIGKLDNTEHLWHCVESTHMPNLLTHLGNLGIFKGWPVAEGEKFYLKHVGENIQWGRIIYEEYDAGDMTPESPNGSNSEEFTFVNYGTNGSEGTQATYVPLDASLNPAEYPAFPFGAPVPPKTEIDIHGVLFMDWSGGVDGTAANHTWLRFMKGRKYMFDPDRNGVYSSQGMSYFVWHSKQTGTPFVPFSKPYTFHAGEELNISLLESDVAAMTALDARIAVVETVRQV